jgi:hypothetical protein
VRRLRGFLAGYLGLIALSALVTEQGSKQASGLVGWLSSILKRALSPGVAAIPDYSAGAAGGGGGGGATRAPAAKTMGTRPNYQAQRQQAGESIPDSTAGQPVRYPRGGVAS